jgi:hypothetical protein
MDYSLAVASRHHWITDAGQLGKFGIGGNSCRIPRRSTMPDIFPLLLPLHVPERGPVVGQAATGIRTRHNLEGLNCFGPIEPRRICVNIATGSRVRNMGSDGNINAKLAKFWMGVVGFYVITFAVVDMHNYWAQYEYRR